MSETKSIGEILTDYFLNSQEPFAIAFRNHIASCTTQTMQENTPTVVSPAFAKLEGWLDNQDVMQMLHISPRTLQTLRSNGTLPFSRINGKFYYKSSEIADLLERNHSTNHKNADNYGN